MYRHLLLTAGCVVLSAVAANPVRTPVLVELFTSEGCSSCPPADRLLQQIDSQVIVLSEHVDYWDHEGWKDRFSSHAFTERQEAYVRQFAIDGPYTPQMVVDGAAQFVGGDARRTAQELDKAAAHPKATVQISRAGSTLKVDAWDAPSAADVMLAIADDGDTTQVSAGENKGHNLHHVAVVRSLRKIGVIKRGGFVNMQVPLPSGSAAQRVIVFLQEPGQTRIVGAAISAAGGV
jgi:hypothetical protein